MKWHLVVEWDEESGRFIGTVPGLSIHVKAESKDEAIGALRQAIPAHLEAMRAKGLDAPPPPFVEAVEIRHTCPCCGFKTLNEPPPGTYDICSVCFWEDDPVQFDDPDYEGGANRVSLRQAQRDFRRYGVSELRFKPLVLGQRLRFKKDREWKPR